VLEVHNKEIDEMSHYNARNEDRPPGPSNCTRSLDIARVAGNILNGVPNPDEYRWTLRAIKHWAKQRGIYCPYTGYFSGISAAIMTARICQLHPNAIMSRLFNRFCRIFDKWDWKHPVMLQSIIKPKYNDNWAPAAWSLQSSPPGKDDDGKANPVEDVECKVYTPAYPSWSCATTVTRCTRNAIRKELRRVLDLTKSEASPISWETVFEPYPFETRFRHKLQLDILAKNAMIFRKWKRWILPKISLLLHGLEKIQNTHIRPCPEVKPFVDHDLVKWSAESIFIGLHFKAPSQANSETQENNALRTIDLRPAATTFIEIINGWPEKVFYGGKVEVRVKHNQVPQGDAKSSG